MTSGWVSHEIAQANAEQAALLSCDSVFQKYPVNIIW
jgi:PIN domain nuclease of toxin-antitoxin system